MDRMMLDSLWRRCEAGDAAAVREALGSDDVAAPARLLRALAHADGGDLGQARRDLDLVVEQQPENPLARLHRGLVCFALGDRAAAARDLDPGAPYFPGRLWIERALHLFWPLRREHPEILVEGVPPFDPPDAPAQVSAGSLRRRGERAYFAGRLREALWAFEQAALRDSAHPDDAVNAAWIALRIGGYETAAHLLEPILESAVEEYLRERNPRVLPSPAVVVLHAWLLHERGEHRAALALLSHVRPEGPDDYYAHLVAGLCWDALGEAAHARAAWDVAFSSFFLDSWQQFAEPYLRKAFGWLGRNAG